VREPMRCWLQPGRPGWHLGLLNFQGLLQRGSRRGLRSRPGTIGWSHRHRGFRHLSAAVPCGSARAGSERRLWRPL